MVCIFNTWLFFQLKNIKKSDAGKYRCVAKNSAGEVYSDECQVLVSLMFYSHNINPNSM